MTAKEKNWSTWAIGLLQVKPISQPSDDVTVDGRVLAEGDGADEVVVEAHELLLEVEGPIVEPTLCPFYLVRPWSSLD